LAQDGRIELAISDDILTETLRVLRDKFQRPVEWLEQAEHHLRTITKQVSPAERFDVVTADPDDNRVLECAAAADSQVIVSGDSDLLQQLGTFRGIPVMTVAAFLSRFEADRP
jgi:putative PIN family toxin of toxin-antitoxin system